MCEEKNGNGRKLTPKQEMFVREYLIDLNATAACVRAGYSSHTADRIGPELLGKTCVKAAIQVALEKRAEKVELNAEWVLKRLRDISNRCVQAEPVLIWDAGAKDWVKSGEYKFDSAGANKATELIGKHLGLFVDRREVSGPGGGPIQVQEISRMTDEELDEELARLTDTGTDTDTGQD